MNLSESNSSIDDVNNLPSIVLPPPTFPNMPNNNNTKITIVMEIKRLIKDMSYYKFRFYRIFSPAKFPKDIIIKSNSKIKE